MSKGRPNNRYKNVLDMLAYKIINGELCAGEVFYSRKSICDQFGISAMTAAKIQGELQERGLLSRVPGRGLFVNSIKKIDEIQHERTALRKVRMIDAMNAIGPETIFGGRVVTGICRRCAERGAGFPCRIYRQYHDGYGDSEQQSQYRR
jgi:DNA-binding transcriptional regulator YhcF (GntR family)